VNEAEAEEAGKEAEALAAPSVHALTASVSLSFGCRSIGDRAHLPWTTKTE
jgi:hypothetical protein